MRVRLFAPILAAAAAGTSAYLLVESDAFASDTQDDQTGTDVDPKSADAQLGPPPPPPPPPSAPLAQAASSPASTPAQASSTAPFVGPPSPFSPAGPSSAPLAPTTPQLTVSSLGYRAAQTLLRYIGAHEEPWPNFPRKPSPNTNRGPVVDLIIRGVYDDGNNLLGKPWCARALRFAFEKAAQEGGDPSPFAAWKGKLSAVKEWKKMLSDYALKEPKVGCAALLLGHNKSHATLVMRVDGDTCVTVEGNHSDQVAIVKRKISEFDFFGDVDGWVADHKPGTLVSGYLLGNFVVQGSMVA